MTKELKSVTRLAGKQWFPLLVRLPVFVVFIFIIYAGLTGNLYRNIASVSSGLVWLVFISVSVLLAGKLWCAVCPWDFLADVMVSLKLYGVSTSPISFKLKYPRFLSNSWLPIVLFFLLVWGEYSFDITDNPRLVSALAVILILTTLSFRLLFEKKVFCRYVCPVGAICGLYSITAPFAVRSISKDKCKNCLAKDCIKGNRNGYGCPVSEYPGGMESNINCILCTECIRSCPYSNMAIHKRAFFKEVHGSAYPSSSGSTMIILLLAFTTFSSFVYSAKVEEFIKQAFQISELHTPLGFALMLSGISIFSLLLFALFMYIIEVFNTNGNGVSNTTRLYRKLSLYAVPFALFIHLAYIIRHVSNEGCKLQAVLADPFGRGDNLINLWFIPPKELLEPAVLAASMGFTVILGLVLSAVFVSLGDSTGEVNKKTDLSISGKLIMSIFFIIFALLNLFLIY